MVATNVGDGRGTTATVRRLNNDLFDELTAKKGATTDAERAKLIGIDRTTLYRFRAGKFSPQLDNAMHMAEVLGTTVEQLFAGESA